LPCAGTFPVISAPQVLQIVLPACVSGVASGFDVDSGALVGAEVGIGAGACDCVGSDVASDEGAAVGTDVDAGCFAVVDFGMTVGLGVTAEVSVALGISVVSTAGVVASHDSVTLDVAVVSSKCIVSSVLVISCVGCTVSACCTECPPIHKVRRAIIINPVIFFAIAFSSFAFLPRRSQTAQLATHILSE